MKEGFQCLYLSTGADIGSSYVPNPLPSRLGGNGRATRRGRLERRGSGGGRRHDGGGCGSGGVDVELTEGGAGTCDSTAVASRGERQPEHFGGKQRGGMAVVAVLAEAGDHGGPLGVPRPVRAAALETHVLGAAAAVLELHGGTHGGGVVCPRVRAFMDGCRVPESAMPSPLPFPGKKKTASVNNVMPFGKQGSKSHDSVTF